MNPSPIEQIIYSFNRLDIWLVRNNWKAYDPFDGLNAKYLKHLTFDNHYLRIALQQAVRRFPLNTRKILGIEKATSSKGMGYCALGYLSMYKATRDETFLSKALYCLEWLRLNYSKGYSGYAWGNHFSYESRGGCIPDGVPTIVWTSLIAHTFLNAYEILGHQTYLDVAMSAGQFIIRDIERFSDTSNNQCFMYIPNRPASPSGCIHNSNVLAASLLSRLHNYSKNGHFMDFARRGITYTVEHQLPDGSWYYGEHAKFHWVDSFHTGYVLESIYDYILASNDLSFETCLRKGFSYFISTFFGSDGTPKYYNHKTYPIDIQCASQAIQTLVRLRRYEKGALELALKVAKWTIDNMQDESGFFYFRKYPFLINKTPMFHWGQSTTLAGLAFLIRALANGTFSNK